MDFSKDDYHLIPEMLKEIAQNASGLQHKLDFLKMQIKDAENKWAESKSTGELSQRLTHVVHSTRLLYNAIKDAETATLTYSGFLLGCLTNPQAMEAIEELYESR